MHYIVGITLRSDLGIFVRIVSAVFGAKSI